MTLKQNLCAKAQFLVQSGSLELEFYNHFVYMALVFCNFVFWNQTRFPGSQERLPKNVWWVHDEMCSGFMMVYLLFANRSAEWLWSKYCCGNVLSLVVCPPIVFVNDWSNKSKERRCWLFWIYGHNSTLWHIILPSRLFGREGTTLKSRDCRF